MIYVGFLYLPFCQSTPWIGYPDAGQATWTVWPSMAFTGGIWRTCGGPAVIAILRKNCLQAFLWPVYRKRWAEPCVAPTPPNWKPGRHRCPRRRPRRPWCWCGWWHRRGWSHIGRRYTFSKEAQDVTNTWCVTDPIFGLLHTNVSNPFLFKRNPSPNAHWDQIHFLKK